LLGSATQHGVLARDPLLRRELPAAAAMFGHIGNVRVRAWGTVGGNLALAEPAQDPPVLLTALDADVLVRGPGGTPRVPVAGLAAGPMTTVLEPGELITHVAVPRPGPDERSAYLKFLPVTADDYATVSVAVRLRVAGGVVTAARIVCGAVGPLPVDCAEAAALVVGRPTAEPPDVSEAWARVSGGAGYVGDVRVPDALHAAFVYSPWPAARIEGIDVGPALEVPGMVAVLTADGVGEIRTGRALRDYPVLAAGEVRFAGQRVAAVAATTREAAREGAAAVEVDYDVRPAVLGLDAAVAVDPLHPSRLRRLPRRGGRPARAQRAGRVAPRRGRPGRRLRRRGQGVRGRLRRGPQPRRAAGAACLRRRRV